MTMRMITIITFLKDFEKIKSMQALHNVINAVNGRLEGHEYKNIYIFFYDKRLYNLWFLS